MSAVGRAKNAQQLLRSAGKLAAVALTVTVAAGASSHLASAQTGIAGGRINERLGEMNYGVCRGTDPECFHNWKRPPTQKYRILVYTRTGVSRHAKLGPILAGGLNPPLSEANVAQREMLRIAQENGWDIDYTEDVTQLSRLTGYNAVVFLSTSRDILDDAAKTALRQYMRSGGGFVGIHNAFGTLYNWPYYEGLLGGANFYDHGLFREGEIHVVDSKDTSTVDLPRRWVFKDEWYNLVPFPTHVRFLATVDETSWKPVPPAAAAVYDGGLPVVTGTHPGHGSFHPVAWCQYYDGGKVWVTTLGHDAEAYRKDSTLAGAAYFQKLIVGGIRSVMGERPFCR